jgi:flagellar motor component MotA
VLLLDKKVTQWYVKEGLTDEDFKGLWSAAISRWRSILPTKDVVSKYGIIKTDSITPLDDFIEVPEEVKPTYKERFPVPAEFLEQLKYTIKKAYYVSLKSRSEGLLKLEDDIGYEDGSEDIFNYGLQFVIDGTGPEYIDPILSNLIEHETDPKMKLLKTIQKEAVLSIQKGDNIRLLIMLIVSYVDDETLKWLKEVFEDDEGIKRFLR